MKMKDVISQRRKELNLTMADIAKACNVSEATVSRWESGDIENMKRSRIASLAKILKISPSVIVGTEDEEEFIDTQRTELHFTDPVEAFKYILDTPLMMAYGGYDVRKMTNQELVDFANEMADYARYIAERKYSKK